MTGAASIMVQGICPGIVFCSQRLGSDKLEICNKIATVICFLLYRLRSENYKKEGGPAQSSSVHCDGLHSGAMECMHYDSARPEVHPGVGLGSGGDLRPVGMWVRE